MKALKSAVVLLFLSVLFGCSGKQLEIKVLYWNIQNGMWADQGNNFDTFVKWVNEKNPDICVWCEGETIYYPETSKTIENKDERYLPKGYL